jgi:hypothetical protein
MKYCVVKDTIKIIDGSENLQEVMLQNALNAGFTELEVEVLTEEEFEARKALEPIPPQEPTEIEMLQQELAGTNAMLLEFMESMLM